MFLHSFLHKTEYTVTNMKNSCLVKIETIVPLDTKQKLEEKATKHGCVTLAESIRYAIREFIEA